jgi:phage baseplate assembly protein W
MTSPSGRHLSFPFRVAPDGRTAQITSLEEHLRDELVQLLLTSPGERDMLPEFGGGIRRLVFEPLGEASRGMAKATITQAITTWLGHRLILESLDVTFADSTIDVEIKYRLSGTEDSRILRFQRIGA